MINDYNSKDSKSDVDSMSLGRTLTHFLDKLKIDDPVVRKSAVGFMEKVALGTINAYGNKIVAIKSIADACAAEKVTFANSEICDFLTITINNIDKKKSDTKIARDVAFNVYKDIMENYNGFEKQLQIHFPRIIVDIASILEKEIDTSGRKVSVYGMERYYQERKKAAPQEDPSNSYTLQNSAGDKLLPGSKQIKASGELIQCLGLITGRSKGELDATLTSLPDSDIRKLGNLCTNHRKLEKYSSLVGSAEFEKEIQKEIGHSLSENQLQHAANSIRKVKTYIENVLDGKFVPHGTHGINHVRHNLEYGYQVMGLMEPRKRRL